MNGTMSKSPTFKIISRSAEDRFSFYTADKTLAGQNWQRNSFLLPLPWPFARGRAALHELARPVRRLWPVWWVYSIGGKRLGRVWATSEVLIQKELEIAQ